MRIVLDTNDLISAFIAQGASHRTLEHCIREHTLVTSPFILSEFHEKLIEKFHYPSDTVREAVDMIRSRAHVVETSQLPEPVCRDSDDDQVLATAVAGGCEHIVTGDRDLLELGQFQSISISTPAQFFASFIRE